MDDLKDLVARNVRRARQARQITQEELAGKAEISARYLGSVERGIVSPSVTVLGRLASALNVEPGELVGSGTIR